MAELSIGEVYRAQMVLKDVARHPKIIGPTDFSDNCRIYLKPENTQVRSNSEGRIIRFRSSVRRRRAVVSLHVRPATMPRGLLLELPITA